MRSLVVLLLLLAGCATQQREIPLKPGEVVDIRAALQKIPAGATKAQVRELLGRATEVPFDSGWEAWVYRQQLKEKEAPPRGELVLLFHPAGHLAKTRVRPVH